MIVKDEVWGDILIEDKYLPIVESREFDRLKNKKQLGIHPNDKAKHTRFYHSVGVYFLACKLVGILKYKLSDYIIITKEDEEAIKIMALCHDIGHGPFSHLAERCLSGTHEENTVKILMNETSEVHKAITENFGEYVLDKVINLIQLKERIKNEDTTKEATPDLIFIISKLLSGGIDIDRLDYIARDSHNVVGKKYDFSELLNYIDLDYINDYLEITFGSEAEYLIANYLNKRFELYDKIYLDEQKFIVEQIFDKYIKKSNYPLTWETEEVDILKDMKNNLADADFITKRYTNIILNRQIDKNIKCKTFQNESQFSFFLNKLYTDYPFLREFNEAVVTTSSKTNIYSSKNRIYINSNGLIKDINECPILNSNLVKEKHIFAIDFVLLKYLLEKNNYKEVDNILDDINNIYNSEIEEEKKYTFTSDNQDEIEEDIKVLKDTLNLENKKDIVNEDDYYDNENGLLGEMRITVRNRKTSDKDVWNIKIPIIDKSSITKRTEKGLNSEEEVLEYLNSVVNIKIDHLLQTLHLTTNRETYVLNYKNSCFEVSFDKTLAINESGQTVVNDMIECELKSGKAVDIYFLNFFMNQFPFLVNCSESKKEIAIECLKQQGNAKRLK